MVMREETMKYDVCFMADRVLVHLWAKGRLIQLAPFIFSDEDFSLDGGLFKQFAMDLGQKVGVGLSKESDGVQGLQRKSPKDS